GVQTCALPIFNTLELRNANIFLTAHLQWQDAQQPIFSKSSHWTQHRLPLPPLLVVKLVSLSFQDRLIHDLSSVTTKIIGTKRVEKEGKKLKEKQHSFLVKEDGEVDDDG